MYMYKIGWSSHGESYDLILSHESRYSKEDIERLTEDALFYAISVRGGYKSWRIESMMLSEEFKGYFLGKGFVEQVYEVEVSLWGWNSVGNTSRVWKCETEEWEKEMIKRLDERIKTSTVIS